MPKTDNTLAFLAGSDEMSVMLREHDWSTSTLGAPEYWPQTLRSAVSLMLPNRTVMFVAWGPELTFLYNEAYIPVFGKKHPGVLGQPFKEIWPEAWGQVEPFVNAALAGESTWSENLHLVLERNGYPEDCWFTFSYSPLRHDDGEVCGLFCAASETTDTVLTERRLEAQATRQQKLFEKAPGFIAVLTGPEHVFEFVNDAYVQLAGGRVSLGRPVRQVFPEIESQGLYDVLDNVYATGKRFVAERLAVTLLDAPDQPSRQVVLDFIYEPIRDEAGKVSGIFVEGHDVTESFRTQAALRESDARYQAIFAASPVPFVVLAPDTPNFTITAVNDAFLAATLAQRERLIGRNIFEVFPDDPSRPGQLGFEAFGVSLDQVLSTRTTNVMERIRYDLSLPDGKTEPHWWEAINAPMLNAAGEVTAIITQVTRVTEQHYRDEAKRTDQKRQAFLLELSDVLRAETNAEAMTAQVLRMLSMQMQLDRCYVGVYRLDADIGEFSQQVHDEHLAPLPPQIRLSDFPDALQVAVDRTLVIEDTMKMEGLSDSDRGSFNALGINAVIAATLRKGNNNPLWAIVAASTLPRRWTHGEVSLVEEVAERTWSALERIKAEAAVHESEERFKQFSDASTNVLWIRDAATMRMVFASPAFDKIYGLRNVTEDGSSELSAWLPLIEPESREAVVASFDDVRSGNRVDQEFQITRATDGMLRWIHDATFPLRDRVGNIQYIAGVGADITDIKEGTDRQSILVSELQHRTRNLITVISALADRTLANATSLENFGSRFSLRLSALSRVQGMLSHLAAGERITFKELLHSELDVYGATNGSAHKFTFDGPDDVPLGSSSVQTFALALHELATNAVKYGALAVPNGHLFVGWRISAPVGSEPPRLQVEWRESGVDMPAVGLPAQGGGYGRELIERALPYQLKAKTTYELGPDGVYCTIDVPMSRTAITGGSSDE